MHNNILHILVQYHEYTLKKKNNKQICSNIYLLPVYMAGTRGVGRNFSRGVVLNAIFQKVFFCTDLLPNTLYRKCMKFAPKKGGGVI